MYYVPVLGVHLVVQFVYRIGELFEIIVDYPDSEPALVDLSTCLQRVDMKAVLMSTLKER